MLVRQSSHNINLTRYFVQVIIIELYLVNNFDSNLGLGQSVDAQLNDGKVTLAQRLLEVVQTNSQELLGPRNLGGLHIWC